MFATDFLTICRQASSILLTGPQSLDGDSIGACLALRDMIAEKVLPQSVYVESTSIHPSQPYRPMEAQ